MFGGCIFSRKAQNRNAQRESRQRKAEYVKALEGLVALQKVDMSAQLQGLLFAIGCRHLSIVYHIPLEGLTLSFSVLIDENMKLRATLGQISTLFADPTQGSRLPDIGVDIHKLKEAVERNDKLYLLDLGDLLRERVGKRTKESQAAKQTAESSEKSKEDGRIVPKAAGDHQTSQDPSKHEPIFGSLTARAEKELLDKMQETGQSFETGLGTLTAPHSPLKASNAAQPQARNGDTGDIDASGQSKTTQIEELFRIFQHTTQMEQAAGSSASAEQPRAGSSHSAQGNNSSTGTPNDFSEYLQTNLSQSNHDNSGALDFNHFLFANGPSPPGFQMPDFSSFGLNMPQFSSTATPYPTSNINDTANAFLHPQIPSLAPSPAFGLAAGDIGSFFKDAPLSGNAASTTLSNLTPTPAISPAVLPSAPTASLKETSKTLHKQATQLIKL